MQIRGKTDDIATLIAGRPIHPLAGLQINFDRMARLSFRLGLRDTHSRPSRRPSGSQRRSSSGINLREDASMCRKSRLCAFISHRLWAPGRLSCLQSHRPRVGETNKRHARRL